MAINTQPIIIEPHPETYEGFPFITLIQFRSDPFVAIIDNFDGKHIKAFVLDSCGPEHVNEEVIVSIAEYWYDNNRRNYPVSFEFSKRGVSNETHKILRTFNIEFVTRVIGPVPKFSMDSVVKIQRRKRKSVPPGVQIIRKPAL